MYLLVMFDISDDKRRTKAVKQLESAGVRVQYSVFECLLSQRQFNRLKNKLAKVIEPTDRIHYIPLCNKDLGQRKADGTGEVIYFPQFSICS